MLYPLGNWLSLYIIWVAPLDFYLPPPLPEISSVK